MEDPHQIADRVLRDQREADKKNILTGIEKNTRMPWWLAVCIVIGAVAALVGVFLQVVM